MRKQRARRLTTLHRGRLILQLCVEPRLFDTQHDKVVLPAIKPVSGIDHLRKRRAMDKPLGPQTIMRISPPPDSKLPLTALDDMYDHLMRSVKISRRIIQASSFWPAVRP